MAIASGSRVRFAEEAGSLSRAAESRAMLCKTCRPISFQKYQHQEMSGYIALGKWREIVQRKQCPFCRLVVRAFEQQLDKMPLHRDDNILLTNYLSWELGVELSPYDKSKSEAYSNKFDLSSMAKKFNYSTYRLLVYIKESHDRFGFIQYIAESEDIDNDRGQFHGRKIDPSKVNLDLLRSWFERCEKFHPATCEDDGSLIKRLPYNLRLIDTGRRCLVRAPASDFSYLTLSYVWGKQDMEFDTGLKPVVINRADIKSTERGKELTPLPGRLPRTIEDAIIVTRQMGFRYLWVDALCIVQDDSIQDKMAHLHNMDAIYSCSALTIVAGSSAHADSGLPGISVPRTKVQEVEAVGCSNLAAMSPSFTDLENSRSLVWNTRAWTFQEKVFAKRILLFTEYQVYFRCSESVWTEEIVMETEDLSKSLEARSGKYRWAPDRQVHVPSRKLNLVKSVLPQFKMNDKYSQLSGFPEYAAAICEYSQRELTNQKDKLIAIDGVLRSLRADAGSFICGLPENYLLQSLLWHPEQGSLCVRESNILPSWTWAAWWVESGVTYDSPDTKGIRTVLLLIRNMNASFRNSGRRIEGSSGPGSSATSSRGGTSRARLVSSSNDSSTGPFLPLIHGTSARDWTAMNAMSKASMNIGACFGWPLLFRHHTANQVFLCAQGAKRRLLCEEALSLTNVAKDEHTNRDRGVAKQVSHKLGKGNAELAQLQNKIALRHQRPVLTMSCVVVRYFIGASLLQPSPAEDDETGCYELLDNSGRCIGETWTTRKQAVRGRQLPMTFLTISWGLSLTNAEIDKKYVPRWDFNARVLPESRADMLMKKCEDFEEAADSTFAKHLSASYGSHNRRVMDRQPSLTSFLEALLTAQKGEPRPRFLWPTVNVLQVQHVGDDKFNDQNDVPIFKRVGVGRVIFSAWLASSSSFREVVLA